MYSFYNRYDCCPRHGDGEVYILVLTSTTMEERKLRVSRVTFGMAGWTFYHAPLDTAGGYSFSRALYAFFVPFLLFASSQGRQRGIQVPPFGLQLLMLEESEIPALPLPYFALREGENLIARNKAKKNGETNLIEKNKTNIFLPSAKMSVSTAHACIRLAKKQNGSSSSTDGEYLLPPISS